MSRPLAVCSLFSWGCQNECSFHEELLLCTSLFSCGTCVDHHMCCIKLLRLHSFDSKCKRRDETYVFNLCQTTLGCLCTGLMPSVSGYRRSRPMGGGLPGLCDLSLSSQGMTAGRSCWLYSSSAPSMTSSRQASQHCDRPVSGCFCPQASLCLGLNCQTWSC